MVSLKTKWRGRRAADLVGTLPIACPPLVFSVALLITLVSVPGLAALYNGWIPMMVASAVAFLPFAVRTLSSALIALPNSLTEASLASGAGNVRTMRSITIPILGPAIAGAGLLVFMYSLRELAAVALLVRPGLSLVPTQIFGYLQTGQFPRANALNVVSLVLPALLIGVLYVLRALFRFVRQRVSIDPGVRVGGPLPALGQGALLGKDATRGNA
jgi:iron(III) transport system permease protein